jgi:hypothetical protein
VILDPPSVISFNYWDNLMCVGLWKGLRQEVDNKNESGPNKEFLRSTLSFLLEFIKSVERFEKKVPGFL